MSIKIKPYILFKRILFILFVIFLINYFSVSTGYYETQIHKKTTITEENIKKFEKDVKNGENIDIKNYVTEEHKDTNNKISIIGYKTSEIINNIITDKVIKIFKFLGNFFF